MRPIPLVLLLALILLPRAIPAQDRDILVTGGWLFAATGDTRVENPGILIRAGKILRMGGDLSIARPDAQVVRLTGEETVIPGMFDLHAHYGIDLFSGGRYDEVKAYPQLFLANGVTSTFPAGEQQPENMRALRLRIDNGEQPGPRLFNSGPYYGTARAGWREAAMTPDSIYREVDYWVSQGVRGFKAKQITPGALQALIQRAHFHGVTVTGHLESGRGNTVNPRDAILMGIDRIEHFVGGDAFTPDRPAYSSFEVLDVNTPEFARIVALYREHRTNYDATMSAWGYYGAKDPVVYTYFTDEKRFFTPYMRSLLAERPSRRVNEQFERIYAVKRAEVKAFYDAGGGDLITLGTDHPSWGEYITPFSVHRELHSFVLAGLPPAAALRIATTNSARALGVGGQLGTVETGKWADLVILRGNPLADIRETRTPRLVIKAGRAYDPAVLLKEAEGTIGPATEAEAAAWGGGRGRGGEGRGGL